MNSTYDFTAINLNEDDLLSSTQWTYPPQSQCYNYNLLHGSLVNNTDLKIESLDETVLNNTSSTNPTTPTTSKKRKVDQNDISFVKLTREQLLVMTSQEFEDRVRLLQSMRPLTLAEEEETKRQRKLIKNREYAQTSRIKKRETLSSLQVQLTAVNTENHILKSHITNLTQQVQYLQVENHQLRMLLSSYSLSPPSNMVVPTVSTQSYTPNLVNLQKSSSPSSPDSIYDPNSPCLSDENDPLGINTSDSDETSLAIDLTQDSTFLGNQTMDQYSYLPGKNWVSDNYTTGLCLLVILFSFGLFFNGVLLEGISVMVAPSLPGTVPTSTGRTLFESHLNLEDEIEDILASMSTDLSNTENSTDNELFDEEIKKEIEENKKLLVYGGDDPHLTPYL
jgi:regulator of replication initiation timing